MKEITEQCIYISIVVDRIKRLKYITAKVYLSRKLRNILTTGISEIEITKGGFDEFADGWLNRKDVLIKSSTDFIKVKHSFWSSQALS